MDLPTVDVLAACSDEELFAHVADMHALRNAAHTSLLTAIRLLGERRAWEREGTSTMAEALVARLGLAWREATEWVRVAGVLPELPELTTAYAAGRLSFDQLKPLSEIATPCDDARLAREGPRCSTTQLEALARRRRQLTGEEAAAEHRRRYLRTWWKGRMLHVRGELPDTDGVVVERALQRLADREPPDPITGRFEPYEARCADALVQLASAGTGPGADAERATIVVHVDEDFLVGEHGPFSGQGAGRLEAGPDVGPQTVRRLLCDCWWQVVAEDEAGRPRALSSLRRTAPAWQRRLLHDRDQHCRFPGCSRPGWLQPHHIVHAAVGGPTTVENQVLLCVKHHRVVHDQRWRIEGDPNERLVFTSPTGRVFESTVLRPDRRGSKRHRTTQAQGTSRRGSPGQEPPDRGSPDRGSPRRGSSDGGTPLRETPGRETTARAGPPPGGS